MYIPALEEDAIKVRERQVGHDPDPLKRRRGWLGEVTIRDRM
jgi:hypothetical protein